MGKQKGKSAKASKIGLLNSNRDEELNKAPHSFVFHRGQVGKNVAELERDLRRVMEPYTAKHLKTTKKNVLKDFVSIAGPLNVSHFMVLGKSETSVNLRLVKLPRGPTLTFKVHNYVLAKDILTSLKKPNMEPKQFHHHPLLVMNNMDMEKMHIKLMATMFQNMFPSINVHKVKLKEIRRCVLLNYNEETNSVELRHFNIRAVPVGMSLGVRKLVKAKIPNLSKYDDVSEFLLKGDASESEAEMDGPHNEVELAQDMSSRGNIKASKSAIRLTEIGPRMSMQLVKVEEGVAEGKVLFHEFIEKTRDEIKLQEEKREKRKQLKAQRKNTQEQNLLKKQEEQKMANKRSRMGMKDGSESDSEVEKLEAGNVIDSDDDIQYYKQEVGEAPESDLFPAKRNFNKRTRNMDTETPAKKKRKSFEDKNSFDKHKSPGKKQQKGVKDRVYNSEGNNDSKKNSNTSNKKSFQKRKVLTDLDRMKRSKLKKQQRMSAKQAGKRRNKPRKI